MQNIKILSISGSGARDSHSACNAEYLKTLLTSEGCQVTHWNINKTSLPFHVASEHHDIENSQYQIVREFVSLAKDADGMVWCTPNYHNCFTGILKNALDHLTMALVAHKPVLLVANGGGRFGGSPCEQLRMVARGLHCVPIPLQIVTQVSDFKIVNGEKVLKNTDIISRFERSAEQLYTYCLKLKDTNMR